MFGWFRRRRRRDLLATPVPERWSEWTDDLYLFQELSDGEQSRALDIARVMIAEKTWEGCDGLELTEEMQVVIAVQAAILLLGLPHDHYAETHTVLVYPGVAFGHPEDYDGPIYLEGAAAGQAWYEGAVLFAWERVKDDSYDVSSRTNVVIHEFAHRLDMQDGWVDGTPVLQGRIDPKEWQELMAREYEALQAAAKAEIDTVLDPYGATNEAEFLAVAVEAFFIDGDYMAQEHPELYRLFRTCFGQDPALRIRRTPPPDEAP